MSLQNDLLAADLERRSKELAALEDSLKKREALLDPKNIEGQLNVLDGKIEYRKEELDRLDKQVIAARDAADKATTTAKSTLAKLDKSIEKKQARVKELNNKIATLEDTLSALHSKLAEVKNEIQERKDYQTQQEEQVNNAILEWSDRLHAMKYEAEQVDKDKAKILADVIRVRQDKTNIEDEIASMAFKLEQLDETYENKAADYRDKLNVLKVEYETRKNDYDELGTKQAMLIREVEVREKSVKIKEIAIAKEAKDLAALRRKLESDSAIYGIM